MHSTEVVPVESTSLAWIRYSPEQEVLEVGFHHGEIYRYSEVPAHSYKELLAAPSKGGYFNQNIRNHFRYKCLRKVRGIK